MSASNDFGLLTPEHGAAFVATIDAAGDGTWQASAVVSISRIRSTIDRTVGPATFASEADARRWLEQQAAAQGFPAPAITVRHLAAHGPR